MYLIARSDAIKRRRKLMGYSQHELSEMAGFGKGNTSIYRIESSAHKVHPLRAKALADVLGCGVEDLFEEPEKAS